MKEEDENRLLEALARTYSGKAGSFATLYFSTIFGVYSLFALTMNIDFEYDLGLWHLLIFTMLLIVLLTGSLFSAFHFYWYSSLTSKAIQWLQYNLRKKQVSITKHLIEGTGKTVALGGKSLYNLLHNTGLGNAILKFGFFFMWGLTVVFSIFQWHLLGGTRLLQIFLPFDP